jgi:hypothetical protein
MMRKRLKGRWGAALVTIVGLLLSMTVPTALAATGRATSLTHLARTQNVIEPTVTCATLTADNFTDVKDAPSEITSATDTTSGGISYCDVKGYISPQTRFEFLLPESTFHGDYLQEGCGGFCGAADISTQPAASTGCVPVTGGEFALGTDDEGHESANELDGLWAANDLALRVAFGYASEHQLAQLGKAVVAAYYGTPPSHSYFDGCSDGGREALMLAERYPHDFDGIVAGSPGIDYRNLGTLFPWFARANTDSEGHQILSSEKLPALHAAVMKACANSHGVIVDPRTCTFNPASIQCPTGTDEVTCLTPAQVTTVREFYRGPTDPQGRGLWDGGEAYGSELAWTWFVGPSTDPNAPDDLIGPQFAINYLRYMAFAKNPPASFTLSDVKFDDAFYKSLGQYASLYNATDPDLHAFRQVGGKLIIYQGWADQAVVPWGTLDYYSAVTKEMGGYANTQQFSRLYMIPGGYHCLGGGDPSVTADFLTPLVNWVEDGQAPSAISLPVLTQTTGTKLTSLTVRPFNSTEPAPRNDGLNSNYHYFGLKSTYKPGNETWCKQNGVTLVCKFHSYG